MASADGIIGRDFIGVGDRVSTLGGPQDFGPRS